MRSCLCIRIKHIQETNFELFICVFVFWNSHNFNEPDIILYMITNTNVSDNK